MVISMNVPATFVQAFWGILLVVVVWKALSFLKLLPAALYLILVHNLCHDWVEQHPVLCYGIFAFLVLSAGLYWLQKLLDRRRAEQAARRELLDRAFAAGNYGKLPRG